MTKTKIAVLVSGGGTNLQALIDAQQGGALPSGEIVLVVSSQRGAYAIERAAKAGIREGDLLISINGHEINDVLDIYGVTNDTDFVVIDKLLDTPINFFLGLIGNEDVAGALVKEFGDIELGDALETVYPSTGKVFVKLTYTISVEDVANMVYYYYYTNYIKSRPEWEFVEVYTDEGITGWVSSRYADLYD